MSHPHSKSARTEVFRLVRETLNGDRLMAMIALNPATGQIIRVANDSVFGLGATLFTGNLEGGTRVAREKLVAGACFVNALVRSDPRLPFGGVKESGYGNELSLFGILEFVNIEMGVLT